MANAITATIFSSPGETVCWFGGFSRENSESEVNRKEKQPFLVNTNTGASASVNPAERDSCSIFQIDFKGGFRALNLTLWRKKNLLRKNICETNIGQLKIMSNFYS